MHTIPDAFLSNCPGKWLLLIGVIGILPKVFCDADCDRTTFKNPRQSNTKWCSKLCTEPNMFGTGVYHEDSEICSAAAHGGYFYNEDVKATYKKVSFYGPFESTIENRLESKMKNASSFGYVFTSGLVVPKNARATDVYVIYSEKRNLFVGCFHDLREGVPEIFHDFRQKEFKSRSYMKRAGNVLTFCRKKANKKNRKAMICRGLLPMNDVRLAFRYEDDDCESTKSTYFLHKGEQLKLDFTNCSSSTPDFGYVGRLGMNYQNSIRKMKFPLTAGSENLLLPGLYSVSPKVSKTVYTPYFYLERTETVPGKFGPFRNETCPRCINGGVCHPLLGTCMCKPGFTGTRCGKVCDFDKFGSKCQHTCKDSCYSGKDRKPCQGFVICQPPPMGCSCARGYKGKYCAKIERLKRPSLVHDPKITFTKDMTFKVQICPSGAKKCFSNHGREAITRITLIHNNRRYPLPIPREHAGFDSYEIPFDGRTVQDYWIVADTERSLQQSDRYGRALKKKDKLFFIYPCVGHVLESPAETSLVITLALESRIHSVPFSCSVLLSRGLSRWNLTGEYDKISYSTRHRIDGLPSGSKFNLSYVCWNKFGRCPSSTPVDIFTYPDPSLFITYEDFKVKIAPFDLMQDSQLDIQLFEIESDKIEDWRQLISCSIIVKSFSTISLSGDTYEENVEMPGGIIHNLQSYMAEKSNNFYIGVLLKYRTNKNEEICWKTQFPAKDGFLILYLIYTVPALLILLIFGSVCAVFRMYKRGLIYRPRSGSRALLDNPVVRRKKRRSKGVELAPSRLSLKLAVDRKTSQSIQSLDDVTPSFRDENYEIESKVGTMVNSALLASKFLEIPKIYNNLTTNEGLLPENRRKNRYKNNLPYDHTRVLLTPLPGKPHSDYINASYVKSFNQTKMYIACQGPKEENVSTIEDFWRMVLQTETVAILMIAKFIENEKKKVGKYFNRQTPVKVGNISVTADSVLQMPHYILTKISVLSTQQRLEVDHYQFTEWPDHGVLTDATTVAETLSDINEVHTQGTIIVHCSAGIGRTGTTLLTLLLNDMLETSGKMDAIESATLLRRSRPSLIESSVQFNFALKIFDELLFGKKGNLTESEAEEFVNNIELQDTLFKQAISLPMSMTFQKGNNSGTRGNNRHPTILPPDHTIVRFNGTGYDFYINAITIPLQNIPEYLIITEHPFNYTLEEFWLMVLLKQCNFLLLLNETPVDEYHPVLLSGGVSTNHGKIHVNIESVRDADYARIYIVTLFTDEIQHQCEAWQILGWNPKDLVPPDPTYVMRLAESILENPIDDGSTILCCEDGVTACGLVTGALMLLDHLKTHQVLNVYRTVVKLRRCRSEFLNNRDQYNLLLEIGLEYLNRYSIYGNFK